MTLRFNPPPNWPQPPPGWTPPTDWKADPRWGPTPAGWRFWVDDAPSAPAPATAKASSGASGSPRVFISYRRADCQPQANGLYDGLSHRLPSASIFMDIDSIPPGADFEDHIRREIELCDLVLVMIGDNWLEQSPDQPGRRIDADDDFVRVEIESALASPNTRVIPVLVEGAEMPRPADLPESVRPLTRFNAIALDDRRWTADVGRLATTIESMTPPLPSLEPAAPIRPRQEPESPAMPPPTSAPIPAQRRTPIVGWIMIVLPMLTFGLAAFVPALWAAGQRRLDRRYRLQMIIFSVAIGLTTYASLIFFGSADSTSIRSDIGVAVFFGCIVIATVVAVINRNPRAALPGTVEELTRRREREQYRNLARRDPNLARTMGVGRPDLARSFSDGGLLDLNSLSAEALSRFGALSTEEAKEIVAARQYVRLASLDDLLARCRLTEPTVARLRETAVFL